MQGEFNRDKCIEFVNAIFDKQDNGVIASLSKYIEIPNQSRNYDAEWATNGLLEKAADHIKTWVQGLGIAGLKTQVLKDEGYSPIIFTEIAGDITDKTIFFYGHFDKQPPFTGWDEGKGATIPVIQNGKLYGRGGADDGYSTYASMVAVKAVQQQGFKIPRIVMITEGDEESGNHVEHYIAKYAERIGNPEVVFCLDSGSIDYEHMWLTNSLRGYAIATLGVKVLTEGVHSGDASGVVPSAYRIINMLINRLEDNKTGEVNKQFWEEVPPNRYEEVYNLVADLGESAIKDYPWAGNTHAISTNTFELVMNRTWRPQLTVTGFTGLSDVSNAGNVSVPEIKVKLSLRLPPNADGAQKVEILKKILTENPPYDAVVTVSDTGSGNGWNAPDQPQWLQTALNESAQTYFGKPLQGQGEGGSIPLMGFLSNLWPTTNFVVTGILGPNSNAHGPNEFLHIDYCKKLTQAMAHVLYKSSLPGATNSGVKKEKKKIQKKH